jgi:F-type H+-transporting ATPase subunit epsilon
MEQDKLLEVEIVTPEEVIFSGKASSVTVPGAMSPFQVLFNHAPIVSSLDLGIVKIVDPGDSGLYFATSGGFTEVRKNRVSIMVEDAHDASKIDVKSAREELSAIKEMLGKTATAGEISEYKQKISIIQNKIKAALAFKGN